MKKKPVIEIGRFSINMPQFRVLSVNKYVLLESRGYTSNQHVKSAIKSLKKIFSDDSVEIKIL